MNKSKYAAALFVIFSMTLFTGSTTVNEKAICDFAKNGKILQQENRYEKEFEVSEGELLEIELKTGGQIEVEGWDRNVVSVVVDVEGRDADELEVIIEKTSGGVSVKTDPDNRNIRASSSVKVKAPVKYNVDFTTMGGDIMLANLDGRLEGRTMGGSLSLSGLKGKTDIKTMGGNIEVENSTIDGDLNTMGGNISLSEVEGDLNAKTMGGNIIHKNVRLTGSGDETIKTMGGNIQIDEAVNGARVKTMGGNIEVNSVKDHLFAKTMGGNIEVKSASGEVEVSTMGGDIFVKVTADEGPDKDIEITTMSGDVELILPENFDMELMARIVYDKDDRGDYEIKGDYEFETSYQDDDNDDDREVLIAKTKSGSGNKKVVIKTYHGNINITKS